MIQNVHSTSYSCPSLMELDFSTFFNNAQISNSTKIRPVGAELFLANRQADGRTDRWTDITKLIAVFRTFANAPQKDYKI